MTREQIQEAVIEYVAQADHRGKQVAKHVAMAILFRGWREGHS